MRHLFLKYLTSTLIVAAFLCLSFGLTEAGAGGFGLFQTRDSATVQNTSRDTTSQQKQRRSASAPMFDDIVEGKAADSVVFDARNKMIYSYKTGDVTYQGMNLKADFMRIDMTTKEIYAYGKADSVDGKPKKRCATSNHHTTNLIDVFRQPQTQEHHQGDEHKGREIKNIFHSWL